MAVIRCPACGKPNPDFLDVCQYCDVPLHGAAPAGAPPPAAAAAAGAAPAEDAFASLRSVASSSAEPEAEATPASELPDWLSRLGTATTAAGLEAKPTGETAGNVSAWLDTLRTGEPEEPADTRDWYWTGTTPESKTPETPAATPAAEDVPDWLRSISGTAPVAEGELPDWLRSTNVAAPTPPQPPAPAAFAAEPAPAEELPDWLRSTQVTAPTPGASAEVQPAAEGELPDWLKDFGTAATTTPKSEPALAFDAATPASEGELPDWLRSVGEAAPAQPAPAVSEGEPPDWLQGLGATSAAPIAPAEPQPRADWLSRPGTANLPPATPAIIEPEAPAGDQPEWIRSLGVTPGQPPETAMPGEASAETPEWLLALGPTTPLPTQPPGVPPLEPIGGDEQPEWLRALGIPPAGQREVAPAAPTPSVSPFAETKTVSPFGEESEAGISAADLGQLPDWLKSMQPSAPSAPRGAEAQGVVEAALPISPLAGLAQAALPSWLEAMRPVEAQRPTVTPEVDTYEETVGVLAGLRGVLRSQPAAAQLGKSAVKIHRLEISETQTRQAGVLTQILAKATEARRAFKQSFWRTVPWARLAVFLIVFAAVVTPLALQEARGFFTPASAQPLAAQRAFEVIDRLPSARPVLVAFDYDPAQAGELDPLAEAILSNLQRHSVPVVGVSTSPVGAALGEALLDRTFASGDYGSQYLNLGYLPGGPLGILQMTNGLRSTKGREPFFTNDFRGAYASADTSVWDTPILANTQQLSDFGAIVLISATPDTVRAWIEQTQGSAPRPILITAISAGAEPLVRPYFESAQISGLVSGILGAAQYERQAGVPGQASVELWDALGWGMLAIILVLIGGNLFYGLAGIRSRRKR